MCSTGLRIVLVVDDILCKGSHLATDAFYEKLMGRFECKDPSYLTEEVPLTYVGFQIKEVSRGGERYVSVSQEHDLTSYLDEIGVPEMARVYNPMPTRWEIDKYPELISGDDISRYIGLW